MTEICCLDQLTENVGVAALLADNRQVALFLINDVVYCVDNVDPYTGAGVMSRGIVGDVDGRPTIASPLLKQKFFLDSGESLQGDEKKLATFEVKLIDDSVHVNA